MQTAGISHAPIIGLGSGGVDWHVKPMILYGIPNCDTVKKARAWLTAAGVAHEFHDYKKAGVPADALAGWVARWGWEAVLNRAGTTFKALAEADKQGLDADKAIALMLANPSMIKRPIVEGAEESDDVALIGFKPEAWQAELGPAELGR